MRTPTMLNYSYSAYLVSSSYSNFKDKDGYGSFVKW